MVGSSGAFTQSFTRARSRVLLGAAVVLLVPAIALAIDIGWRHVRWHAGLQGVRFVDHEEKISAGTAAVTVTGYVVATVDSDVDFFAMARNEAAHPQVNATLCESGTPLDAWFNPMPREMQPGGRPYSYAVLVPLRSREGDLSRTKEDLCVRFRAVTMNPLSWVESKAVVIPLQGTLRDELEAYAGRGGTVQLALDPGCAPHLCEPDFSAADLRP